MMMRYPEWASGRVPPGGIVVIIVVVVVILRGVERKERKVIPICGSSAHNRRDRLGSRKRGVLSESIYNGKCGKPVRVRLRYEECLLERAHARIAGSVWHFVGGL